MSNNQDPEDNNKSAELDYRSAGVDIEAGNSLVSEIAKITKGLLFPENITDNENSKKAKEK